jgi:predicted amino acid dehydrogenase
MKAKAILSIIGATGTISKSLRKYLSNILRKYKIKERQKKRKRKRKKKAKTNSHIGHCTHTKENINLKVQNIFHVRNNITCSTNCKYRTAATLCTLAI